MRRHWPLAAALLLAEVARISFWAITGRRYEDALITLTHAENAAAGVGLVHHPQEGHIHGFTSALSALIPLAGEVVHHGAGMPTIKVVSLFAAAATIAYAYLIAQRLGLPPWPTFFLLAYLALDYNQIIFAMGGMETQIAVALLLASAYHVMRRDAVVAGLLLGFCVLARPDFVVWVVCALVWLYLNDRARRREATRTALLALAVLAPWLIFTSLYYGSPVPHTLVAKSVSFAQLPTLGDGPGAFITYFRESLARHGQEWTNYAPFLDYHFDATAPAYWWLGNVAFVVIALAVAGAWLGRRNRELWPLLAFGALFYAYYLLVKGVAFFPWYLPPFMAIVALLVAIGLTRVSELVPRAGTVLAAVLALAFALPLPWYFKLERNVQKIDDSVRTKVGLYLKAHATPDQSITSESAGYIGYYGRNLKLFDFPGLTSDESVDAARTLPPDRRDLINLISVLRSDWLTLRAPEYAELERRYPQLAAQYRIAAHFSVPERETPTTIGKIAWVNLDRDFYVLRRTTAF